MTQAIPLTTIDIIRNQLPAIYEKIGVDAWWHKQTSITTVKIRTRNGFVGSKIQVHIFPYVDGIVCRFSFAGELEQVRWRLHPGKKVPGF